MLDTSTRGQEHDPLDIAARSLLSLKDEIARGIVDIDPSVVESMQQRLERLKSTRDRLRSG
ncbi:MAG: hypothetical protein JO053_11140, partial [Acidobacteria bacterium]|nr:hypothetical protein [Acidobacteriota bacterium]